MPSRFCHGAITLPQAESPHRISLEAWPTLQGHPPSLGQSSSSFPCIYLGYLETLFLGDVVKSLLSLLDR